MRTAAAEAFTEGVETFSKLLRTAKKNRLSLASHAFYGPRARAALAKIRKSFLMMKRDYPEERFPRVSFQLETIEPLLSKLIAIFPEDPKGMLQLLDEIAFKVSSDLSAEFDSAQATPLTSGTAPFLPGDLVTDRYPVLQNILWEVNRSYDVACYNSCAAMIRRLVESLIIEAFEQH